MLFAIFMMIKKKEIIIYKNKILQNYFFLWKSTCNIII